MKVHIVTKDCDSRWAEDRDMVIVKVFKGTRRRAAIKLAEEAEEENPGYVFDVGTWEAS